MNYQKNYAALTNKFKQLTYPILINEVEAEGYLTTAYLGVKERRHLNALQPFEQGDYIEAGGTLFLVMEEVVSIRGHKYRATIEVCDHTFIIPGGIKTSTEVGRDSFGKPIYEYTYFDPTLIPVVINSMERAITLNAQMPTAKNTIFLDLQESDANKGHLAINKEFDFIDGKKLKVIYHDYSNSGRLGVACLIEAKM